MTKELDILIGRKAHHIRYIHPARAWLLISPSLPSRQVNMAPGQLLNEVFILLKVIIPSPGYLKGWRIFKMTAVVLRLKSTQELVFKAFKIINAVVALIASRSDRLTDNNIYGDHNY